MEIQILRELLWSQFGGTVEMLQKAIQSCPAPVWNKENAQRQYWQIAFHALFFLDLYLSGSRQAFRLPEPFKVVDVEGSGRKPEREYSREELLGYAAYCRDKLITKLTELDEEHALQRCGFPWLNISVAELFLYNMRHVQHHSAQLGLILRTEVNEGVPWVFKATG